MKLFKVNKPFVFNIFGASGDLAKVKLFPALYALAAQKRISKEYYIFGFARSAKTNVQFRQEVKKSIQTRSEQPVNQKVLSELLTHVYYFSGSYDRPNAFRNFAREILTVSKGKKLTSINYLSVPPKVFIPVTKNLAGIQSQIGTDMRVVMEKPFGHDERSAREIFHHVSTHFEPAQIFLLDHYLGKEAVQSILTLRYANSILNTLLKGSLIANIQITAAERVGVANRINYFDQVGIIKDMIQSHLLQMLALLTMQLPVEQEADGIAREKYSVLSALKYRGYQNAMVLGQHQSYKKTPGVKKTSRVATFAAIRLFIDRQNWYRVPIYIRTGKMLKEKHTYVVVEFKKHSFQIRNKNIQANKLIIELYPNEKVHLKLYTKVGGTRDEYHDLTTSESIACYGDDCLPEHGRLLLDVFREDHSNFLSFEEIIATWKFTDKLLRCCQPGKVKLILYDDYSNGPEEQYQLTEKDGFHWHEVPSSK